MLRSPITPLDALRPIGLAELDARAALQQRVDVKYVVGFDLLDALLERLAPTHRALEIDGRRSFSYATSYFDTPDLRCYRDHLQGRRRRFKCRTRRYVDSDVAAFEVKLKATGGRTVKHRRALARPVAALDGDLLALMRGWVREAYGLLVAGPLDPALRMRFQRVTLVAPERGERLTCDTGLTFAAPGGARGRLAGGTVILESKSRAGAALADTALRALGARPVAACSKYGLGIALTRPGVVTNPYRPLLRRHFEEAA